MKLRRLASFVSASAIIVGLLGQSASMVLATGANTQYWQGQGTTGNNIDSTSCDSLSAGQMLWIWTGDGTHVQISVGGEVVDGDQQGKGAFHFITTWHDISTLVKGDGGNVFVTYDGAVDGNAQLTMSHACEGTTTTTTTTEPSTTTTTTTEPSTTTTTTTTEPSTTTTTTTTESSTTTTSFSQTVSGTTDVPTEPNTATIEIGGPASAGSSAWMLIVALGLLLGSVVILTPAPSKTKR